MVKYKTCQKIPKPNLKIYSVGDFFLIRKILDILDKLKDSNGSGNVGLGLLIGVGGAVLVLLEVLFLLTRRKTSN
jgi:hypothetical protein